MTIGTPQELNIASEKIIDFFRDEWDRPISLGEPGFYNWQFKHVPHQNNIDSCCLAKNNDDEIVGVMGVNSRLFILDGEYVRGAELTTWIIKPEYRNKSFASKMITFLQEKYHLLMGMGITNDALPVYLRNGFHYLRAIPRYIKILNWDDISRFAKYTPLAKKVDRYWKKTVATPSFLMREFNEDSLKNINSKFYMANNMFSRNIEYIHWRYQNHPEFNYELAIVYSENCDEEVFVSTRTETGANGIKILHIMDMYGSENNMLPAINFVIDKAENLDIPIIDFFSTNSKINSYFTASGWFSTTDDAFFQFPHLFQPLELRNPATTSLIYWTKLNETTFWDIGKLYLTKQDADFDRPVLTAKNNEN